jgi:putative membrane protein
MRLALLAFIVSAAAFAHEGEPVAPHDALAAWSFDPGIVIPLIIAAVLYWRGASAAHGFRTWERRSYWTGWWALVIALISPVHAIGESLFSAHMTQHEILMVVAAPLLVLGRPLIAYLWALPEGARRDLGRWSKARIVQTPWRAISNPIGAWAVHAVVLWGWHAPVLFDATLRSDLVHSAQHISFLGSALLFWWSLVRGRHGAGVLSLFTTGVHTSVLGALLTFSPSPWYAAYSTTTQAWGLTPLEDQQIGGLIMWVPAGMVYVIGGLALLAICIRQSDARVPVRALAAAFAIIAAAGATWSCENARANAAAETGGNPQQGRFKIAYYGCGSCHEIPGVAGADGLVGPPLTRVARRVYLGGVITNTPSNMEQWIGNPRGIDEKTAMPTLGVTENDARDITAYLYTLK